MWMGAYLLLWYAGCHECRVLPIPAHPPIPPETQAASERGLRSQVEGEIESLRQENERRARAFKEAVRVAAARAAQHLEGERDELQRQLQQVGASLGAGYDGGLGN